MQGFSLFCNNFFVLFFGKDKTHDSPHPPDAFVYRRIVVSGNDQRCVHVVTSKRLNK